MSVDDFLKAAQSLLTPQGAAAVFLGVILLGIGIGVVLSFRRTLYKEEVRDWLTVARVDRALNRVFEGKVTPGDAARFRAALLDDVEAPAAGLANDLRTELPPAVGAAESADETPRTDVAPTEPHTDPHEQGRVPD